jgi:hypothetical protein
MDGNPLSNPHAAKLANGPGGPIKTLRIFRKSISADSVLRGPEGSEALSGIAREVAEMLGVHAAAHAARKARLRRRSRNG